MEKITVLDIITTAQGGKRLLEYRVSVINGGGGFINYLACPGEAFFTGGFAGMGIPFEPFPMSRGLNPLTACFEIFRFIKLLKRLNVDVLHAHTSKAGAVSRIGCALYNIRAGKKIYVCYQVHSFYFNTVQGLKSRLFRRLEIILSRFSDVILFQNQHELEQARQSGMDKRALLINIGNGINLKELAPMARVRSLPRWIMKNPAASSGVSSFREECDYMWGYIPHFVDVALINRPKGRGMYPTDGIKVPGGNPPSAGGGNQDMAAEQVEYKVPRPFVIICVARVEPKKNHAMLIDAAVLLRKKLARIYGEAAAGRAFSIICAGEIGETWITEYAEKQGLGGIITFTGIKDKNELALLLDRSDLSVLTSTAEGKPRALMESMCMGIPCIATGVCGTRDVIEDGRTGRLSPLGDAEAFAECLFKIMHDPEGYRSFSERSLEKAKNEFDENKVIEKLKSLYREKPKKPLP
ncbi:MAG: glycosyltransferase [Treponema sp.]|jgi:glycosyltransferase involved in cell wall biosynthesis|nr:glycosyltransferase [Treponema sp.]